jgi:hypothetical protein
VIVPGSPRYDEDNKDNWTEVKYLSTQGYKLSQFSYNKGWSDDDIRCIRMTFTPDAGGATVLLTLGNSSLGNQ